MRSQLKNKQQGYVTVEYLLVTGIVFIALIFPLPNLDHSVLELSLDAIKKFQSHSATMLALP